MSEKVFFPNNILISEYKRLFSTPNGKDVLAHMLFDLCILKEIHDDEDKALHNYGCRLLTILGGKDIDTPFTAFLARLLKQPLEKENDAYE